MKCLVKTYNVVVNNPDLPILETMQQFTLNAIAASGNLSMTDEQKWALNRFFYKIEFEKPDSNVCQQIVHSMMPDLTEEECALVGQYGFSGGQLENIVRKLVSYEVMNGSDFPRMETIRSFCESERIGNSKIFKKIGF